MEKIEKIRAEIERLKKNAKSSKMEWIDNGYNQNAFAEDCRIASFDKLLSFLDTLSEEPDNDASPEASASYDTQKYTPSPSVDIGDVARVQFASHAKVFDKKRKAVFDWGQFKEVVGIFYSFGKKDSETKENKQPDKSLEEAADEYSNENEYMDVGFCVEPVYIGHKTEKAFIAGAEWQAKQLLQGSPMPEDTVLFNKGVEEGKRLMMEEAVEGVVMDFSSNQPRPQVDVYVDPNKYCTGDKVRIIVLKEEEEV